MTGAAIVLFTDFGPAGPYLGQVEIVLRQLAPSHPVIHFVSNAPCGNPRASAYLLASLRQQFPQDSIFLCVIDPGVGGARKPVVLQADGQTFVGPDNGLLNTVAKHAERRDWFEIVWRPENCSMSFHGRDLFAPVAARLALGQAEDDLKPYHVDSADWPEDLAEIIYFDGYGNAFTGLRYRCELDGRKLMVDGRRLEQAGTFSEAAVGAPFWYCNSCGLVEIAVNQGHAERQLGLRIGMRVAYE
ncbi:MAG: SAM-dependent chlorinase/fluorinase [Methylomicrobium sp.]|nr:SAM-dependent chlorinase/fluorinase [Methylomicrobium sp.]